MLAVTSDDRPTMDAGMRGPIPLFPSANQDCEGKAASVPCGLLAGTPPLTIGGELTFNRTMERDDKPSQRLAEIILKACCFSAEKHQSQRRKNRRRTPYINHPLTVASILWHEGQVRDGEVLAAALLHDTVEDTETTFAEIETHFGVRVRNIVAEVTDDKTLSSNERKKRQVSGARHLSREAKLVKLADKISNLRDVNTDPPEGWSLERRAKYFQWAEQVVGGLRGTNEALEVIFDDLCRCFYQSNTAR